MADLLVVGTGLIGTSIGLAVMGSRDVVLSDRDPAAAEIASERGAGRLWDGQESADLVIAAVPPKATAATLLAVARLGIARTFTHVTSVQSPVQAEIETLISQASIVCGGHPVAGSESSGPGAARADLFAGRPWVLCPGAATTPGAVAAVDGLARACGAEPVVMSAPDHDAAMALVSHLPQAVASAVAAQLLGAERVVRLGGGGLRDTTRIAASDPALWREILTLNANAVAPLLRAVAQDLSALSEALAGGPPTGDAAFPPPPPPASSGEVVEELLRRGRAGRALLPVKGGEVGAAFSWVAVALPDRPGRLVAVLASAAEAGVNVEDVRLEHVPGRPRGLAQLAVRTQARAEAVRVLRAAGHDVLASD
jgi:prephenate dehydrogenase